MNEHVVEREREIRAPAAAIENPQRARKFFGDQRLDQADEGVDLPELRLHRRPDLAALVLDADGFEKSVRSLGGERIFLCPIVRQILRRPGHGWRAFRNQHATLARDPDVQIAVAGLDVDLRELPRKHFVQLSAPLPAGEIFHLAFALARERNLDLAAGSDFDRARDDFLPRRVRGMGRCGERQPAK